MKLRSIFISAPKLTRPYGEHGEQKCARCWKPMRHGALVWTLHCDQAPHLDNDFCDACRWADGTEAPGSHFEWINRNDKSAHWTIQRKPLRPIPNE